MNIEKIRGYGRVLFFIIFNETFLSSVRSNSHIRTQEGGKTDETGRQGGSCS